MKRELSVFLITKQEGANLRTCLESVKGLADEIIILDSGSTDDTLKIAAEFNAKIGFKEFESFTEQKNAALKMCTKPWALSLDADERLTPELRQEIADLLSSKNMDDCGGYYLKRSSVFLGRRMKHSGVNNEKILRLVKTASAEYTGGRVHEVLEVKGQTGELKNIFLHNTYTSIEQYFYKFNRYTSLGAQTMAERGKKFRFINLLRPPLEFFKIYVLKLACLDGIQGFLWALFSSMYPSVKYAKLWEIYHNKKQ
ncbi:MAG: glycosyltransferase family 2 protein [Elusimicrobia bacterium]|nr:glycosyltransferase family 2 protein [Elusimicrobiota bacterium]